MLLLADATDQCLSNAARESLVSLTDSSTTKPTNVVEISTAAALVHALQYGSQNSFAPSVSAYHPFAPIASQYTW